MGGRSGRANSVLNQMCGRGGVADDVTVTSPRGYKGSTCRRSLQSQENGLQALRRQLEKKTKETLRLRSLESGSREQGAQSED